MGRCAVLHDCRLLADKRLNEFHEEDIDQILERSKGLVPFFFNTFAVVMSVLQPIVSFSLFVAFSIVVSHQS